MNLSVAGAGRLGVELARALLNPEPPEQEVVPVTK